MDSLSQQPSASSAPQERSARIDSTSRKLSVSFDPESQRYGSANHGLDGQQDSGRRRSSFAERIHAFTTAGGPNSLDAFARSWQRAVGFHQITPVRQSFIVEELDGQAGRPPPPEPIITPSGDIFVSSELDTSPMSQRSLLREQLAAQEESVDPHTEVFEETPVASPRPSQDLGADERSPLIRERPSRARVRGDSIFQIEPQLSSSLGGTYGSTWGSLSSRISEPSMRHAGRLFQQQQLEGVTEPDKEREPLLVKQIQEADGTIVNVVVGQSTLPQTVFNSINTLVGVGILAVPLAMSKAGWFAGLGFLVFSGVTTSYTAKLLAKCLDKDNSVVSYGDIAYIAGKKWGRWLQLIVSIVFLLELVGACVALVILFADTIAALDIIEGVSRDMWFIVFGCFLVPTILMPLRWLSFTSIVGIVCCSLIMALVVFDGLSLDDAPGSLHEPMATQVWPSGAWATFYAWGILMAPWGGHSVFPNIYRDMRHPYHFRRAVNVTYLFTVSLVAAMAIIGYLMFGDYIEDEISKNLVHTTGYPKWVAWAVTFLIAVMPITKAPLNAHPIVATAENVLGLDHRSIAGHAPLMGLTGFWRGVCRLAVRLMLIVLFVFLAWVVPSFDIIMSLLGSLACFTICIIFPCFFHLRLYGDSMSWWHKALDYVLIIVGSCLVVLCTAATFVER